MEHATVKNNMKPTLLTLPRETRDQMYGYFLTIDRSAEYLPDLDETSVFDLTPMNVSRQMREETLDVLKTTNLWIRLSVIHHDVNDRAARGLLQNLLQFRQPVLCTGHLDMSAVHQNATLEIIVVKGDLRESEKLKKYEAVSFACSQMTYAHLSHALWDNVDNYNTLVVHTKQLCVPKGLDIIKTFLRPLSIIRGVKDAFLFSTGSSDPALERIQKDITSTVTWDWKKMICAQKSFQARGNRAFGDKRYVEAIYHYDRGALVSSKLATIAREALLDLSSLLSNENRSIDCDVKSNYTLAVNKLVESRRSTSAARESIGVSLMQLTIAIVAACNAFWVGLSDKQRCKAHYRRGIAIENRAEYEFIHGPTSECYWPNDQRGILTKPTYDDAAKDLYYALQLNPNDSMIKAALARVDARLGRVTDQRHAPMIRISMASGAIWEGDERLKKLWGEDIIFADEEQRRPDPDELKDLDGYLLLE